MRPNRFLTAALAALAAVTVACSTLEVNTDYEPGTDFARYKTYAFKEGAAPKNPIARERFLTALSDAMGRHGLAAATGEPDLLVFTHFVTGKETQINTYGYGMGGWYGYRWGGGMTTTQVQEIPTGTVVVDLVDVKANKVVWRGVAKDQISTDATPEERAAKAAEVASKLFENYPPAKK